MARLVEVEHGLEPPADLVAAIHRETDGNPFFVGEILKLLAAEGQLHDVSGLGARIPIPPSVREAIPAPSASPLGRVPARAGARGGARA